MRRITHRMGCLLLLLFGFLTFLFSGSRVYAEQSLLDLNNKTFSKINDEDINYSVWGDNSIYFVGTCSTDKDSSSDYSSAGTCGEKLTANTPEGRLREAVEKFGEFAMAMQEEYGVPWEAMFFHMYGESQMGLAGGVSTSVAKCGRFNTMGYVYSSSSLYGLTEEQMGNCKVYHGDNKALAAQFNSYEDMMASFYVDYLRNGMYDSAFSNLNPKSYDLEGFLRDESNIYSAAGWDGRVPGYGAYKNVWNSVKGTINSVAKKKGWPSSAKLAKDKNIPIGGKYPVSGDIKKQMKAKPHSLSACNGNSPSGSDESDDSGGSDDDASGGDSDSSSGSGKSSKKKGKSSSDDSDEDSESSSPSGTSFKINPKTPAGSANTEGTGGFWYLEGAWGKYPKTVIDTHNGNLITKAVKIDKDFFDMPYFYAENYDYNYNTWPVGMKANGKKSTRKYYLIVLPSEAYSQHMGDRFIAYFEKRKEPVYFITYDVWACEHHYLRGMHYCDWARKDPDKVNGGLANNSLGHFSTRGWDANNQLGDALGKLTCLHRLTTHGKTLARESSRCSGAVCTSSSGGSSGSSKKDYPEHIQQTGHTCGPASMSMLASAVSGKEVSEGDVISVVGGNDRAYAATGGAGMTELDKKVGEKYGFDVENVSYGSFSDAEKKMTEYLNKGYMLHFSGAGSYPFTKGGHYIGVFGWTDKNAGKVMIADSNKGNAELKLHDVINAGLHYDFAVIKNDGGGVGDVCEDEEGGECSEDSDTDSSNSGSCSERVLSSVDKILDLAAKNGSTYTYGGIRDAGGFKSILNDGAAINVDCTGFASLVMYDAFGVEQPFCTADIASNPNYVEVSKSEVRPGDIFAYNYGCTAHGGIVAEVNNGRVTKIAQTGASRGYANIGTYGKNNNLGYTKDPNGVNGNLSCVNGGASDAKFYRYKGCK